MRPLTRINPQLPAGAYNTYALSARPCLRRRAI